MAQPLGSKEAQAQLIDPMNAPEPSAETGLGSHFGSTYAAPKKPNSTKSSASPTVPHSSSRAESVKHSTPSKAGVSSSVRSSSGSPREKFPNYRAEAFGDFESTSRRRAGSHGTPPSYKEATTSTNTAPRRRGSSLKERYPGDKSGQPLDMIRRDSRKANRSPHLHKKSIPGADSIDRLDPAIGGRSYHHEGPYDAALMSRNRDAKKGPLGALKTTNDEALKATPRENIKDAVERHKPLDGVAAVPPGQADRFGRTYNYKEGADLMREATTTDAGYKRWPGKDYDPEDLKGESEPMFSLDRALKANKVDENGAIEMDDRAHLMQDYHERERKGKLDQRDPVDIAGDDSKYVDMELANASTAEPRHKHISLRERIGSLKQRNKDD